MACPDTWTLNTLTSLFGSHRIAFYSLWNYLWLVIAATLTVSLSMDPENFPGTRLFRIFLGAGFAIYAIVNLVLLDEIRTQMTAVVGAMARLSSVDGLIDVPSRGALVGVHLLLDAFVVAGHLLLIRYARTRCPADGPPPYGGC